jgi:hypothetical protein
MGHPSMASGLTYDINLTRAGRGSIEEHKFRSALQHDDVQDCETEEVDKHSSHEVLHASANLLSAILIVNRDRDRDRVPLQDESLHRTEIFPVWGSLGPSPH